jgi:hypothetical protein
MIELATRAVACKRWRWMPGMRVMYNWGGGCRDRFLCMDETYMHLSVEDGPPEDVRPMTWIRKKHESFARDCVPDFDDPATLGCLLALVRQAWPIAPATTARHGCYDPQRGHYHVWTCSYCTGSSWEQATGDSEAEALVAALEAAP